MKERRDINDVLGIPPGKVEGLKGKMRALLAFFFFLPLFLVALIKQGEERERGEKKRESLRSLP